MTEQIIMGRALTAPTLIAPPASLLDTADVRTGQPWISLTGLWESVNCQTVNSAYVDGCVVPGTPSGAKTADPVDYVDGFRFAAYKGTTCKMIDLNAIQKLNTDAFLANESTFVEAVLGQAIIDDAGTTDLTPTGGAVTPKEGLAILEGHAGLHYAGVPTVHASTQIVSLLDSDGATINEVGSEFRTRTGSKLVNGNGYYGIDMDTPDLAAGEAWLFATGEVVLTRAEAVDEKQINTTTNDVTALAERLYVAGWDCYSAAVKVKVF